MNTLRPCNIIYTQELVEEPVVDVLKTINNDTSRKIIVNGGRGNGKSVVLEDLEKNSIGSSNPTITMCFDSIINYAAEPNEYYDQRFFEHIYELTFAVKLLTFIKTNYIEIYKRDFAHIGDTLEIIGKDTDNYIRNVSLGDMVQIKRYLSAGEFTSLIIETLKKNLNLESLNIALDRFDWVNGKTPYVQGLLSNYFQYFDKSIITVDDDSNDLLEQENNGFSIISIDYNKDINCVKEIIKRRMDYYNQSPGEHVITHRVDGLVTDDMYQKMINETNGNLSMMIDIFHSAGLLYNWHDRSSGFEDDLDHEISEKKKEEKQLRLHSRPPKLYI